MAEEDMDVPVDDIIPFVDQSRERFEDEPLVNLAQNIKTHGLLQSGVAWYDAGRGKYVLICGERRWRASKLAGLPTMRLKVLAGTFRPGQMLALNLSENLQRETLGVVERGRAFRRLAQLENITGKQVAERMHVSDSTVSRDMAILDLPEPVIAEIAAGRVPASVGYELTKLCNDPDGQLLAGRGRDLRPDEPRPSRPRGPQPRGRSQDPAHWVATDVQTGWIFHHAQRCGTAGLGGPSCRPYPAAKKSQGPVRRGQGRH